LDLFAGSGALGLEALSRGAASCVFVDESRNCAMVIGENLRVARLGNGRVVKAEAIRFLAGDRAEYDLVLADPPYARSLSGQDLAAALLHDVALPRLLAAGGLLVVEVAAEQAVPEGAAWRLLERRTYGGCAILLYERSMDP
jgi:16S rRNA (guanine(966)-N(2))-methyltransferase RsmD